MKQYDRTIIYFILTAIILLFAPFIFSKFIVFVLSVFLINIIYAVATWCIFHQAGQALFAVAAIAGIGGYSTALLGNLIPNTWITMAIVLVISSLMGLVFYILSKRVPGHIQFAILNLAVIFVFRYFIVAFTDYTQGIDGLTVSYFTPQKIFADISHRYWVVLIITLISMIIIQKIMTGRLGRIFTLIGRNRLLASTVGINTDKYLLLAYLIFLPFIGIGGALYSHFIGFISPDAWNPDLSLIIIFCSLIGGTTNIFGPIVGAVLATGIPISFDITAEFRFGIVGILAITIFIFKPEGIVGWIGEIKNRKRKKINISSN